MYLWLSAKRPRLGTVFPMKLKLNETLLSNSWLAKSKKLVSFNLITSTFLQVLDKLLILSAISLDLFKKW